MDVVLRELNRCEPGRRVRTHGVERDVAEVEEARVAHDHVQADGHHRVDGHDHGGVHLRPRSDEGDGADVVAEERVDHRQDERDERRHERANGDAPAEDGDGEVVRNPGEREKDGEEEGESVPRREREHDHDLHHEDDDSPGLLRQVVPAVALLPPERAGVEPASGAGRIGH